jgi:hypothetical protein
MKENYNLDEAVKKLYKVEPLRRDFAAIVANKAFGEQKRDSTVLDKLLFITLCFVITASLIYGLSLLGGVSLTIILIFVVTILGFIGLSIKEHFILLNRIGSRG